jgi:hypothetical protein
MKTTGKPRSINVSKIFQLTLSLCKKLIVLNFGDMFPTRKYVSPVFCTVRESCPPSTLNKLKINVPTLTDCLYLLNGSLVCLSTLIINVSCIYHPDISEHVDVTVSVILMITFRK